MPAPKVSGLASPRSAVMSNVVGLALHAVAVAGERADHHDRALGEGHVAVLDLLVQEARGERRDRLVAQQLLDRRRRAARARAASSSHCSGCAANRRSAVRELRLRRVDAADQHVQHEVHALDVGEPVALLLGGDQRRDQVVAGVVAARARSARRPTRRTPRRRARSRSRSFIRLGGSNWRWIRFDHSCSLRRVLERRAHHRRDRQRRVGLGERLHELAAARARQRLPEPLEELAHRRAPAVGGARREGRVDEVAQAPVVRRR